MVTVRLRLRRLLSSSTNSDANLNNGITSGNGSIRKQQHQQVLTSKRQGYNRYLRFTSTLTTCDESTAENSSLASSRSEENEHHPNRYDYGPNGSDPYADVRERMEALVYKKKNRKQHPMISKLDLDEHLNMCDSEDEEEEDDDEQINEHYFSESDPEENSSVTAWLVYMGWTILISIGHVRELLESLYNKLFDRDAWKASSSTSETLAPLMKSWESFYTRRIFVRFHDSFNRPIASNPGSHITVLETVSYDNQKSMKVLGPLDSNDEKSLALHSQYAKSPHYVHAHDGSVARRCLNLGSYNYLGFADDWQSTCADSVKQSLTELPVTASSSRQEYGTTTLHRQVEQTVAEFLDKEDAIVLPMGFNTNGTVIPALVSRGDLIISDKLNHTSIVIGARSSGAAIRVFRHNDMKHLEKILRESVLLGRPRSRRPWNKILVIVEGIYSMEGEFCKLRDVVKICKKYGAYVYLDEAHSIGATGLTGRGCAEVMGVDTQDIHVMMGTFTKSFGGIGGYIAADKNIISMLRAKCTGSSYHNSLSPTVCQQVLTSFKVRYLD
jgi:serine palmitoyltransferase